MGKNIVNQILGGRVSAVPPSGSVTALRIHSRVAVFIILYRESRGKPCQCPAVLHCLLTWECPR